MASEPEPRVMLAYPAYPGAIDFRSLLAAAVQASESLHVTLLPSIGSEACRAFNLCWAAALTLARRGEATHFAMLHSDVCPEAGWLDVLMEELRAHDAHLVSAVIPIKTGHGVTSTAIDRPGAPWYTRRLTMTEVFALPETFGFADTIAAGLNPEYRPFLVNTGCFVLDLRKPEWYETNEHGEFYFHFTMNHRVRDSADGLVEADAESEDWFFSRRMAARGLRYYATRKVRLQHVGPHGFPNTAAWGDWKTDLGAERYERHTMLDGWPALDAPPEAVEWSDCAIA